MSENLERKFQLTGWLVFVICAAFFIIQASLNFDIWSLIAGITFMLGCVLFLTPYILSRFYR